MAGVMVLLALMLIFSAIVFQSWEDVLRRDNEAEMVFRAEEIVRAIMRYRKDHQTPPLKLEQLMEPGPRAQYYMRRLYTDPLTEDGRWGMLYLGPNQEIVDPNAPIALDQLPEGASSARRSLFEDLERDRAARAERDRRRMQTSPLGGEGLESELAGGRVLHGQPIAGVKSLCKDEPFRIYKGKEEYAEWLFTYLDLMRLKVPGQDDRQGRGQPGQGLPGSPGIRGGRSKGGPGGFSSGLRGFDRRRGRRKPPDRDD